MIDEAASIHPMCPIEEYAIRGRIWVWFKPPSPPVSVDSAPNIISAGVDVGARRHEISAIGPIFCHVERRMQRGHLSVFITRGNQK